MNEHPNQTDEIDLDALRRRTPEAVERWFSANADPLYSFVFYRVGRDPDAAEEVVQETFLAALGRIGDYDPALGTMLAWLTWLSRNRIRSALRRKGRLRTASDPWEKIDRQLLGAWHGLDSSPLPDEALERQETAELVQMALANLSDEHRRALRQRYYEQRSLEEIARARGTTAGAVKSLLHRARAAFKVAFDTIADSLGDEAAGRAMP